jgi:hypothetical protein
MDMAVSVGVANEVAALSRAEDADAVEIFSGCIAKDFDSAGRVRRLEYAP